jgi:4-diphosphocytidyl-2-C-methyl-D-erythritol kinase
MVSFPHAKINLGLNVVRKREDGFHDLQTCFYPIPWTDILEIIPSSSFKFSSSGLTIDGAIDKNLCVKAYNLLREDFNLPAVQIHLHKIIPMGAGLGGGSSDAAFTLLQLNDHFSLSLSDQQLQEYAASLGSDCAFFISKGAKFGTGRGEILSPIAVPLAGKFIVVVKPPIHVSTADAFSGIVPDEKRTSVREIIGRPIENWRGLLKNDFEETIFRKYPSIQKIKESLYEHGALYASMSGSGSSVFGIFQNEVQLADLFRGMLYWSSKLD